MFLPHATREVFHKKLLILTLSGDIIPREVWNAERKTNERKIHNKETKDGRNQKVLLQIYCESSKKVCFKNKVRTKIELKIPQRPRTARYWQVVKNVGLR